MQLIWFVLEKVMLELLVFVHPQSRMCCCASLYCCICWEHLVLFTLGISYISFLLFCFNQGLTSVTASTVVKKCQVTTLTNNDNDNTYRLSSPSLASSWQTKYKMCRNPIHTANTLNGPVYIYADIATPGLATNCCPGNGLNHARIMECPGGHKTFSLPQSGSSSLLHVTLVSLIIACKWSRR